jgi:2-iminoacetate synthase ThiH
MCAEYFIDYISVEAAKVLTIWCDSFANEALSSYQRNNYKPYHFSFVKGVHVNLGLSKTCVYCSFKTSHNFGQRSLLNVIRYLLS